MTETPLLITDLAWQRGALALAVQLAVPLRGVTALFGPSGSGKTSVLRVLAGIDRDARGSLRFGDAVWQDSARHLHVSAEQRRVAYVDQHATLFPHLDVADNLDFGFRRAGRPAHLPRERWIEAFGLQPLLSRRVAGLSGGERQRVAIVRALLSDPLMLLLDEPLSALDAAARDQLLGILERLGDGLDVPMIYVSHAIDEVVRLADQLVLFDAGRVAAQGPLADVLARSDLPPALADAAGAVVEGEVVGVDPHDHLLELRFAGGVLHVPAPTTPLGPRVRCRIAARDVTLALSPSTGSSALNQLVATVTAVTPAAHPAQCMVSLDAGGAVLLARITQRSWHALGLAPGMPVVAQVKAVTLGR